MASPQAPAKRPRRGRWLRRALLGMVLAVLLVLGLPWLGVTLGSAGRLHEPAELGPDSPPVALVLGASVRPDGSPSRFLQARLDLAADLYHRGQVRAVLVSGDHSARDYDEPGAMARYLTGVGVPAEVIVQDAYGLDTYDSCQRAKRVFGLERAIVVTQAYHLPRAVTTCRLAGIDAHGVGDRTVQSLGMEGWPGWAQRFGWWRFEAREKGANLKTVWDVVSRRQATPGKPDDQLARILDR